MSKRDDRPCPTVGSLMKYLQRFPPHTPVIVVHDAGESDNTEFYSHPMYNVVWPMKRDPKNALSDYCDFVYDYEHKGRKVVVL